MARLVVGLGNPGPDYADTRHNVGFRVALRLAERLGASPFEEVSGGRAATAWLGAEELHVLMPETWMNRSGGPVAECLARHPEIEPARDLLVVFDDIDLPFGRLRLRPEGGAGGHNGLGDVLDALETRGVPRLRFGVGRPPDGVDAADYVLAPFDGDERRALPALLDAAAGAVLDAFELGVVAAMNRVNRREEEQEPE